MKRKHIFTTGALYHIFNRGVRKNDIFNTTVEYLRWEKLLSWCANYDYPYSSYLKRINGLKESGKSVHEIDKHIKDAYRYDKPLVKVLAYVEMPNHFHIMLEQNIDTGIPTYMKKLQTAYSMYINKKYELSGSVYEGVYKSVPVVSDPQFIQLLKYILRNPVEAKLITSSDVLQYRWSSAKEYHNLSKQKITTDERLPRELLNPSTLKQFILKQDIDFSLLEEIALD